MSIFRELKLNLMMALSADGHQHQLYAGKNYYEYHIKGVVEILKQSFTEEDTEEDRYIMLMDAFGHDLIEDVKWIKKALLSVMFGEEIANDIQLLSKDKSVPIEIYRATVSTSRRAARVKIADSTFNKNNCIKEGRLEKAQFYQEGIDYLMPFAYPKG